jgi:hypothetical protein
VHRFNASILPVCSITFAGKAVCGTAAPQGPQR